MFAGVFETLKLPPSIPSTNVAPPPPGSEIAHNGPWYDKIIHDPVNLISITLAVIAVILGILPLVLWYFERRKSVFLEATLKEFSIIEKLREKREEAFADQAANRAEAEKFEAQARAMREDVEKRIPNAAMIAYYENTIPQLELEILDLSKRTEAMRGSLFKLKGTDLIANPQVQKLLSQEISKNVGARRALEQNQIFLIVFTSLSVIVLGLIPYPFLILAHFIVLVITAFVCFKLIESARVAFPDNKTLSNKIFNPRYSYSLFVIFAILLLILRFAILVVYRSD